MENLFCFVLLKSDQSQSCLSYVALQNFKGTRENAKSKSISCGIDLTNDDLQNEDYSCTQPSNSETGLGVLDHGSAKEAERIVSNKRGKYIKYSAVQRHEIGKYTSGYSIASTLRKYKGKFPQLNESTICLMRQKYEEQLRQPLKEKRELKTKFPTARCGRQLMIRKVEFIISAG